MRYILRLKGALQYALAGLKFVSHRELAFQTELFLLPLIVVAGLYLGETGLERALLIGSWLFVMIVELLNTAIEAVVDRIGTERHELSGVAKDLGAAAVLLSLLLTAILWAAIIF